MTDGKGIVNKVVALYDLNSWDGCWYYRMIGDTDTQKDKNLCESKTCYTKAGCLQIARRIAGQLNVKLEVKE